MQFHNLIKDRFPILSEPFSPPLGCLRNLFLNLIFAWAESTIGKRHKAFFYYGRVAITFGIGLPLYGTIPAFTGTRNSEDLLFWKCDTSHPGCDIICYNRFLPIMPGRLLQFQVHRNPGNKIHHSARFLETKSVFSPKNELFDGSESAGCFKKNFNVDFKLLFFMIPDVVFLLYFARFEAAKKRTEIAKNPNLKVKNVANGL